MLIEFSVSNFLSFRERQTFSMVAGPRLKKTENTFRPDLDEKFPRLLKIAAIYGPNASGKSNLTRALGAISSLAGRQPKAIQDPLPGNPFRFDSELSNKPSCFEVHFINDRQRYQFELSFDRERIVFEKLTYFPRGKETLVYSREYDGKVEKYSFSDLEGGSDVHEAWRRLTGPAVLFIAQAVANSSDELKQLKSPFAWLSSGLNVIESNSASTWSQASRAVALAIPKFADVIAEFLSDMDVPITKLRFDAKNEAGSEDASARPKGKIDAEKFFRKVEEGRTTLTHRTALGDADFDFDEESTGTQNLIGFWLPFEMLRERRDVSLSLVWDELDSSLHPEIVASLVRILQRFERPIQLIFTTHDTHLMDTRLLRRDQFWLTERNRFGATTLRSIHDFEGRDSEDIEKRYYEGRYRGLPYIHKRKG